VSTFFALGARHPYEIQNDPPPAASRTMNTVTAAAMNGNVLLCACLREECVLALGADATIAGKSVSG
jgi:hypothetical protein